MEVKITVVEGGYTIETFDLDKHPASTSHVRTTLKEAMDLAYEILKKE